MNEQATAELRSVHVARQPIVDAQAHVVGYELLFRADAEATEASSTGAYATSSVLVTACTEFGLDRLGGGKPLFVNLTREFLVGDLPLPFEPGQAVLEILETVPVDQQVVAGVRDLVRRGYAVALDDFLPGTPSDLLLDHATYVKIDTLDVEPDQLRRTVGALRLRPDQRLVAERVETQDDLTVAEDLGFTLFQGYLFARPQVLTGQRLTPSRLRTLELLSLLADPAAPTEEITAMVSADPALTYRLLTAANSAAAAVRRRISSIRDAAVLVGAVRLRHWLTLMAVADLAGDEERASTALIKARFCHEIALQLGLPAPAAFTVGLLDAVCDLTGEGRMAVTRQVPLAPDLAAALAGREGPLGQVLTAAAAYQHRRGLPAATSRRVGDLASAYLAAITWTGDLGSGLAQA